MLSSGGDIESILTVLIASAGLLGLVTYLTQTYEAEMDRE
jgi:Tfp pilus assembly protein PilV